MDPYFLTLADRLPVVAGSVLIAILSSFVAVEFAGRVRDADDLAAKWVWIIAGSVSMGSGIWAMHFVGMSAARYPFQAAFEPELTALSWLVAVLASAFAYFVCGLRRMSDARIAGATLLVGAAMTAMHFIGMSALVMAPGTVYDPAWSLTAFALAWAGAAGAMRLFRHLHGMSGRRRLAWQLLTAIVLGTSYSGMHYLAMAATDFADGAICLSAGGLRADQMGNSVGGASLTMLATMLLMISLQRRAEKRATESGRSLDRARLELRSVSLHDTVTRLPNRLVFQDRLKQACERCARDGCQLAVMFIDLDAFNTNERSWNGTDGESILRGVAAILKRSAAASDTVASVGGNQFLLIVDGLGDVEPVVRLSEKIAQALATPFPLPEGSVRLTVSIGIAMYPSDGVQTALVGLASTAAAAAADAGGGRYRFFEPAMNADAHDKSEWFESLGGAVARNELELHYQPKFHVDDGTIAGVEALLRWRHPVRGMVSPAAFIPLAEKFGLIGELGSWVIETATRQMREWSDAGLDLRVAINVSAHQLAMPGLSEEIAACLGRHGVDPRLLTCELTETAAMQDIAVSLPVLQRLEAAGVQVSIDDFGTGFSSLSYLRRLPIRQVKIDRSFVNDLCDSEDARAVVASIINLAHTLRLEVVAEGVETRCQSDALTELGCDKFQGFLFARPMPPAELRRFIEQARSVVSPSRSLDERASADSGRAHA